MACRTWLEATEICWITGRLALLRLQELHVGWEDGFMYDLQSGLNTTYNDSELECMSRSSAVSYEGNALFLGSSEDSHLHIGILSSCQIHFKLYSDHACPIFDTLAGSVFAQFTANRSSSFTI